jgi:putative mRNA 3-end processing factor
MLRLSFLGAMNSVGSSGVLVESDDTRIVMDYGTNIQELPPTFPFPVSGKLDGLLLTHAHLDHAGGIAIIEKRTPCPVYALPVSKPLVQMLLNDSIKISDNEGVPLPFDKDDVDNVISHFKSVEFGDQFPVGKAKAVAYDAGHIPGSMMPLVQIGGKGSKGKNILYTGDFNTQPTRLMKGCEKNLPQVDILITESTYAARAHRDRENEEKRLVKAVEQTIADDGIAIISNFAISRTQELLLILDKYGIDFPLYMDGMARKATTIINSFPRSVRESKTIDKALRKVQYLNNNNQRKKALKNPCAIMTTSGMLNGGPVVYYIQQLYDNPDNLLLLTGYQVKGTPGNELLETGRFVHEDINLKVKMRFDRFDFSAHAGREDLFEFIEKVNPKQVFCVHGDDTIMFAEELREKGFEAHAPIANNRIFKYE